MSFGPFHVLPIQRLLLEGDLLPRLGSRALDLLVALVERAGELVSKGELMARVWPDTLVEESNLRVQVAALRRASRRQGSQPLHLYRSRSGATGSSPLWRINYMNADA
jgi:DNA-binding winged helix-turn-helix (wHTH) protein